MKLENARQEKNMIKSAAFHSHKCLGKFFAKWRTYSRLMVAKRQLRDLQAQKEKSKAKVQTFLKNIESFENEKKDNSCLQGTQNPNQRHRLGKSPARLAPNKGNIYLILSRSKYEVKFICQDRLH